MTSNDISTIETIAYLGTCSPKNDRFSNLEMLQQHQQFHVPTSSPSCEHECNCMHHHHHHNSNDFSSTNVSNGPSAHHHNHFNHLNQHMHSNTNSYMSHHQKQHHQDGNLIYNNSISSECNQATNESSSQSGCTGTVIHYVPTSNLSALNIIPSCECVVGHIQHHHHQRQSSTEQSQSIQSGRSSRLVSCDENNPSGAEDGGGSGNLGIIITTTTSPNGCRLTSKRLL